MGAGRSGVSGKKTELKLVDGDAGVPGASGCSVSCSKGDDVLGKICWWIQYLTWESQLT